MVKIRIVVSELLHFGTLAIHLKNCSFQVVRTTLCIALHTVAFNEKVAKIATKYKTASNTKVAKIAKIAIRYKIATKYKISANTKK